MQHREKCELLFKQIAEGFNLTEGEIAATLKQPLTGLENALKECFQQIRQPRKHFSKADYDFLTKTVGCLNLEEVLNAEPLSDVRTPEQIIVSIMFTEMPLRFTYSMLMAAVYPVVADADDTALQIVELFSHRYVGILVKEGDYYAFNPNSKVN